MKRVRTGKELSRVLMNLREKFTDDYEKVLGKLALDGFNKLIEYSAEDTRFLKSKWSVTTAIPDMSMIKGNKKSSYSVAVFPQVKIKAGDIITLYNNTQYAFYLEFGTPKMESQPMIQPTLSYLTSEANAVFMAMNHKKME